MKATDFSHSAVEQLLDRTRIRLNPKDDNLSRRSA